MSVHVLKRTTAPASAPTQVGQHWIDTTTSKHYLAKGTASVADWVEFTADTDTGITQLTGDVTAGPGSGSQAATIANGAVTNAKVASGIDAAKISSGVVSNTEFDYLNGVTSDIQTQINSKMDATQVIPPAQGGTGISMLKTQVSTTGTINDQAVATGWIEFTGTLDTTVTGFVAQADGTKIRITNKMTSGKVLTLSDEAAGSTAANRIALPSTLNLGIANDQSVELIYSASASRWVLADSASAWSTSGNQIMSGTMILGNTNSSGSMNFQGRINGVAWLDISGADRKLYGQGGSLALSFGSVGRKAFNISNQETIDWDNGYLKIPTGGAYNTVEWIGGKLHDASAGALSIDWSARQLVRPDATPIFDWSQNDLPLFKSTGTLSGFYFEGGSTPYLQYDSVGDVMSTGNFNRFIFNNSYVQLQLLEDSSSNTSVYVQARTLHDDSGTKAMEWTTTQRQLFDFGGSYPSVDYGNYQLLNIGVTNSVPLLDWATSAGGSVKIYQGYGNYLVGDFSNGQLLAPGNGALTLDWNNYILYDNYNSASVDWNYHYLSFMGDVNVDWQNKYLQYNGGGGSVISIDWGNFKCNNSGGFLSVDYGNHKLYDITGSGTVVSLDYAARQLLNSSGNALGDWSGNAFQINGSTGSNNGTIWTDVTRKALQVKQAAVTQSLMGIIFTQTATGTAANTVAETTITSTGIGTLTLPVDFFTAGKTIRLMGKGIHSGTASPNLTIRVKFGSTTILTTGSVATGNATNEEFEISAMITCRTTGVSGTIFAQGDYIENATTPRSFGMVNTAATTLDTTTTHAITVTAQWSAASASNTISLTNFAVEVLN